MKICKMCGRELRCHEKVICLNCRGMQNVKKRKSKQSKYDRRSVRDEGHNKKE